MNLRRCHAVAAVEIAKLMAQLKVRLVFATCVIGPFLFTAAMRVQRSMPSDTLFGRAIADTGLAIPLVVLGFAALWVLPVLAAIVAGDIFAAEDRYGTWTSLLTRSCARSEVFAGKVLVAASFTTLGVLVLGVSSAVAGIVVIGRQPIISLSGMVLSASEAEWRIAAAWLSVLPAALGLVALAVLASIVTRSSAAGIGLPVLLALTMQLAVMIDGPGWVRNLVIVTGWSAWHGLFVDPPFYGPLLRGLVAGAAYLLVGVTVAYRVLQRRDVGR